MPSVLYVRVIDAETGSPLPGARVVVSTKSLVSRFVTSDSGEVTVGLTVPEKTAVLVNVLKEDYSEKTVKAETLDPSDPTKLYVVVDLAGSSSLWPLFVVGGFLALLAWTFFAKRL